MAGANFLWCFLFRLTFFISMYNLLGLAIQVQRLKCLVNFLNNVVTILHLPFSVSWERAWSGGSEDNEKNKGCFRSQQYYESRKAHSSPCLFLRASPLCSYMHAQYSVLTCVHNLFRNCCAFQILYLPEWQNPFCNPQTMNHKPFFDKSMTHKLGRWAIASDL